MQESFEQVVQEYCRGCDAPARIDRAEAVIREVKILGLQSRNGRSYRPEALAEAAPLYEGARVNVNHPAGDPTAPRDYRDRLGTLENVRCRPMLGLFADFRFNPKHALAEQLLWDAEHAPQNVGFSHNIQAELRRDGQQWIVERILKVHAVDLVADPATTQGLFESAAPGGEQPPGETAATRQAAGQASPSRAAQIAEVLREFHLPEPQCRTPWAQRLVSREFLEALAAAPDEPTMRAWAADRAALVLAVLARAESLPPAERPICREQIVLSRSAGGIDCRAFVEAITRPA